MFWTRMNWQKLFSYGEVMCFVSAWLVTLWMASTVHRPTADRPAAQNMAIRADISGLQARLRR